jgi:hypothetical protein
MSAGDLELIEVDAAELKELLAKVSPEVRDEVLFAIGLCNLPPMRVMVPNPSREVH